jgi:hypothetical protein
VVPLPEKCGSRSGIHNRLRRWSVDGTWAQVFTAPMAQADAGEADHRAVTPSVPYWSVSADPSSWPPGRPGSATPTSSLPGCRRLRAYGEVAKLTTRRFFTLAYNSLQALGEESTMRAVAHPPSVTSALLQPTDSPRGRLAPGPRRTADGLTVSLNQVGSRYMKAPPRIRSIRRADVLTLLCDAVGEGLERGLTARNARRRSWRLVTPAGSPLGEGGASFRAGSKRTGTASAGGSAWSASAYP